MFGWLSGILAGLFTWFVLNFLGTPFLEFRKVRQEIQEELTYLADIRPPSQSTFYGGTEEDYESEVRIFADAREKARRLGSKLTALYINWPLPYVLGLFRYDLDR